MDISHLGLKRLGPRRNVGLLVFSAVLCDVVLWTLILAGLENVSIPLTIQ